MKEKLLGAIKRPYRFARKVARPAVWSAVKLVAKELLRMKDLRAAKLLLLWAKNRLC